MATPIGRILLMPKGDYSGSAVYNALDWVRYSGSAWVCTTDNTTGIEIRSTIIIPITKSRFSFFIFDLLS